jgi:hypothetical protein
MVASQASQMEWLWVLGTGAEDGELALFCPACPQPGLNCNPSEADVSEYVAILLCGQALTRRLDDTVVGRSVKP